MRCYSSKLFDNGLPFAYALGIKKNATAINKLEKIVHDML